MEKDYEREMQGCVYGPPPIDIDEPVPNPIKDLFPQTSGPDSSSQPKESNRSKKMFIITALCLLLLLAVVVFLFVIL